MSARPPFSTLAAARAEKPAAPARGSLGWVKSVLGRSMQLEQKRKGPVVVAEAASPLLTEQRAELGARLLVHDPATQAVRNLFRVHDELTQGWAAVQALAPAVLARALTEAEILCEQEPSPVLGGIVERLAAFKAANDSRAAAEAAAEAERSWTREQAAAPEVSEGCYEEFTQMERSWVGTVPAGL